MADGRRDALNELRAIKARRERRARSTLIKLEHREAELRAAQAQTREERAHARDAWRACGELERTLDHDGLQALKGELAEYSARDQALTDRLAELASELNQVRDDAGAQRTLQREAARDQEKLDLLIESLDS